MTDTLQDDVLDIIATKGMVARDTLQLDKKLSDLNISSLDVVEIVFALEDKFDIQIPFNANDAKLEFETVGEVVDAIKKITGQS